MPRVLMRDREGHAEIQREGHVAGDRGRGWTDAATGEGSHQDWQTREDSPREPLGEQGPANTLFGQFRPSELSERTESHRVKPPNSWRS